jgi:hypothetical protein
MKFVVRIDDRVWTKCAKRLAVAGIVGTAAEVLEALLVTSLTDIPERPPEKHVGDTTISTSLMLTLGKVRVEQVPEDPRP